MDFTSIPLLNQIEEKFGHVGVIANQNRNYAYFACGLVLSDWMNGWKYKKHFWTPLLREIENFHCLVRRPTVDRDYISRALIPRFFEGGLLECKVNVTGEFQSDTLTPNIRLKDYNLHNNLREQVKANNLPDFMQIFYQKSREVNL
jgi:hypothetical protein